MSAEESIEKIPLRKKMGLGRGLDALLGEAIRGDSGNEASQPAQNVSAQGVAMIAVAEIRPNPDQPRRYFSDEKLDELAASISRHGIIQRYELIAGERRWRAARRAGLAVVPAIVRTSDDLGSVEKALVENLHREDLTPLEEAAAYQQLIEDFHLTHEQIAVRMGKSRSAVSNTLRLLSLPAAIQHLLADGRLSAGHAKALLTTPDRAFQEHLARRAANENWSVRMLEEAVRDRGGATPLDSASAPDGQGKTIDGAGLTAGTRLRPPGLLELEELLAEHLSTRVKVSMGARRGKVVIDFADLEDLERIYHQMTTPSDIE